MTDVVHVLGCRQFQKTIDTRWGDVDAVLVDNETEMGDCRGSENAFRFFETKSVCDCEFAKLLEFFTQLVDAVGTESHIVQIRLDILQASNAGFNEKLREFLLTVGRTISKAEWRTGPLKFLAPRNYESRQISGVRFQLELVKKLRAIERAIIGFSR
jgi:hypothetical protein